MEANDGSAGPMEARRAFSSPMSTRQISFPFDSLDASAASGSTPVERSSHVDPEFVPVGFAGVDRRLDALVEQIAPVTARVDVDRVLPVRLADRPKGVGARRGPVPVVEPPTALGTLDSTPTRIGEDGSHRPLDIGEQRPPQNSV